MRSLLGIVISVVFGPLIILGMIIWLVALLCVKQSCNENEIYKHFISDGVLYITMMMNKALTQ